VERRPLAVKSVEATDLDGSKGTTPAVEQYLEARRFDI
jgi:hypothetical protein